MIEVKPLRGYSEERKFYVYVHKRPDGSIFYVGKGHDNRAWVKKSRNKHWQNVVNKHGGFGVEIIEDILTEQEAFTKERELILSIGMENLTNQTIGGISTTGYTHTEETLKLQSEIAKNRLKNDPEKEKQLRERLAKVHELQKNDPEYKAKMAQRQRDYYASLPEEEKERRRKEKAAILLSPEVREKSLKRTKELLADPNFRKAAGDKAREYYASLSEEERKENAKRLTKILEENRPKLVEAISKKVVVNRLFVFKSVNELHDFCKTFSSCVSKAKKTSLKHGFDFLITSGLFIEDYCEEKHSGIPFHDGLIEIPRLDFDCIPRSKAVVMDESTVFLSMNEASKFCNGKTVEATADFITKNIKLGKPAMGHYWRVATSEEIKEEIFRRLNNLINNYKH